jgi:hypothetical protein
MAHYVAIQCIFAAVLITKYFFLIFVCSKEVDVKLSLKMIKNFLNLGMLMVFVCFGHSVYSQNHPQYGSVVGKNIKQVETSIEAPTPSKIGNAEMDREVSEKAQNPLIFSTLSHEITGSAKSAAPYPLPFTDDFSSLAVTQEKWNEVDANNDGITWVWIDGNGCDGTPGYVQTHCLPFLGAMDGDDYLITQPIIIPAAGQYHLSFFARPKGTEYVDILYGTSENYQEMEVLKSYVMEAEVDAVGMFMWIHYVANFDIEIADNYHFAIYYHSVWDDFGYSLDIDNVEIDAGYYNGVKDIKLSKHFTPVSGCGLTSETPIGIELYNIGTDLITDFTLSYKIGNSAPVSQTFSQKIDVRERATIYFDQLVDFSEVGEYHILFTVETINGETMSNKNMEVAVRHFAPITDTEFPFECDFLNEEDRIHWDPYVAGTWRFNEFWNYYYNVIDGAPFLSRCFNLQPGAYFFSYHYAIGLDLFGEFFYGDFYVAYGKSGTDPATWTPVKEYFDLFTGAGVYSVEDDMTMFINEEGDYQIGFFPVNTTLVMGEFGTLRVMATSLDKLDKHDFRINEILGKAETRITPAYHAGGERTYTVVVENRGSYFNETGSVEVLYEDASIATSDFEFTALGQVVNVNLDADFLAKPGEMVLTFNAEIESGITQTGELLSMVSDSTFAHDFIDTGWDDGMGMIGGTAKFGTIFDIYKKDTLTSITVGLYKSSDGTMSKNIGLAVYKLDYFPMVEEPIFEVVYPRTEGDNEKGITFAVPSTILEPGKYYFETQQLDLDLLGVAFDLSWQTGGHFYDHSNDFLSQVAIPFGYLHIRPNFGIPSLSSSCNPIKNLSVEIVESDAILIWDAPSDIAPEKYLVYCNDEFLSETTSTTYTQTNITSGLYLYCVEALYEDGCTSEKVCEEIIMSCNINVELTLDSSVETSIHLSWLPVLENGRFKIYKNSEFLIEVEENEYVDFELEPEQTYCYTITALCPDNTESEPSNEECGSVIVSIEELQNDIKIHPNPTDGELTIENGELKIENVDVYDMMGRKVQSFDFLNLKSETLNISSLPAGVYFIRIQTENGTVIQKVVKN